MCAQFLSKISLLVSGAGGNDSVNHLTRVLHYDMGESYEILDCNEFTRRNAEFANRVEDCDSSTQDRSVFNGIDVGRDPSLRLRFEVRRILRTHRLC